MIILIRGNPGVGKTTLIKKIIHQSDKQWGGFYTQELRVNNNRLGFLIITLDGQRGVLAHRKLKSTIKVGKYYVNLSDLENIGVASIESAILKRQPLIVDEIGKMELQSSKFKKYVAIAVELSPLLIATVSNHDDKFIDSLKRIEHAILIDVTHRNRDLLDKMIMELIK